MLQVLILSRVWLVRGIGGEVCWIIKYSLYLLRPYRTVLLA